MQCTDDSNFVGDYLRGKRHGYGVYSFPNGDRYEGQYVEDLPHGHGTYHFASGQCYQGQWQQGKKHGWSVYTVDNGEKSLRAVCTAEAASAWLRSVRYTPLFCYPFGCAFGEMKTVAMEGLLPSNQLDPAAAGRASPLKCLVCNRTEQLTSLARLRACLVVRPAGSRFMGLWSEGKPTFVQPLDGETAQAAPASALATAAPSGEVLVGGDESKQLALALAARDEAARVRC